MASATQKKPVEVKRSSSPTKQGAKYKPIPPKEYQFGQPHGNPRSNGHWRKEDTARYKLEQMTKLTEDELSAVIENKDAPCFERRIARAIKDSEWHTIESMINQVYGKPKETSETILRGEIETNGRPYKGLSIEEIQLLLKSGK